MKSDKDEIEGYLVGLIVGDGHIESKTNRIVIASNNEIFTNKISSMFNKLKYQHSIFYDKSATVWKIGINSNKLYEILTKKYNIPIGNKTFVNFRPNLNKKQLTFFIAGLFDAEGWGEIDKGKYFKVRIKMKNKEIISFVREILEKQGFQPKGHTKADKSYVVEVNKQPNVKRFFKKINVLHPKWTKFSISSLVG